MRIVVLMEDTCGNPQCAYEHGLSVYVETENHRLLVDTGASGKTLTNAGHLDVDLSRVDTVILSHGHYDHSGGILPFCAINRNARIYLQRAALGEYYHGERYIGIEKEIAHLQNIRILDGDAVIDGELSVFSGITGRRFWPQSNIGLSVRAGGQQRQDTFAHEQCLVVHGEKTLLLSGCAHNGILNILDRYRALYNALPDIVISGFHMMKKTDYTREEVEIIRQTAEELECMDTVFYTGHCTGQKAIGIMQEVMKDKLVQIHCGMEICG